MLDDYKKTQPFLYKFFVESVRNNKLSHAYLIETNNVNNSLALALAVAKYLFCSNLDSNNEKNKILNLIDNNNYPNLKIISPEKNLIKKEQILKMQEDFSKSAIDNNYQIYIIESSEKMNDVAVNALLKFLEEPSKKVIAIILADNLHNLLDTIISRCQTISLIKETPIFSNEIEKIKYTINDKYLNTLSLEQAELFIKKIVCFLNILETDKQKAIGYLEIYSEKENILSIFNVILYIYMDILKYKLSQSLEIFFFFKDELYNIIEKNEINTLIDKINIVNSFLRKVQYNVNKELFIDNFIVQISRSDSNG